MTRISGFGSSGPHSKRPCFDVIAQAMSGLMELTGQADGPPTMAGTFVADYSTALYATIGTLGALQARTHTGRGQLVEATLMDSALSLLITALPEQILFGRPPRRNGNRDRFVAPSNTFQTLEGRWVLFQASGEEKFQLFSEAMGRPELPHDPRFSSNAERLANVEALEDIIADWIRQHTAADVLEMLEKATIPCAKVATVDEVVSSPQVQHNGSIIWTEQAGGKVPMQGFTVRLSDTPMELREACPSIGQHTEHVLEDWLGCSSEEVSQLRASRAI